MNEQRLEREIAALEKILRCLLRVEPRERIRVLHVAAAWYGITLAGQPEEGEAA